jgi:molybdopterin-guanine dinucleotide biosynthesis protein A
LTGVILSGGENARMPVLKGFLEVEGRTIIGRSIDVLRRVFEKVVISTNMPERYFSFGLPMVGDIRKERCPMTGILSVLVATAEESVFVTACDMPFISGELIRFMVREHRVQETEQCYDAVIPVFKGEKEALFGIYTRAVIPAIESAYRTGDRRITGMLAGLRVRYITEAEVRALDPMGDSFVNVNTMKDYDEVLAGLQAPVTG